MRIRAYRTLIRYSIGIVNHKSLNKYGYRAIRPIDLVFRDNNMYQCESPSLIAKGRWSKPIKYHT